MFGWLFKKFGGGSPGDRAELVPPVLPEIDADDIRHMLHLSEGLPQVDWDMACAWAARRAAEPEAQWPYVRAIAGAWLEAIGAACNGTHRRFQVARVEGLAPEGDLARIRDACLRSIRVIESALRPIRGDEPAAEFCLVALGSYNTYVSFTAHFHAEEGQWATSGGMYLRDGHSPMPIIVLPTSARWAVENTIAHEFTHHALAHLGMPLWIEEGLTQMMEERVTGVANFVAPREILERHAARWGQDGLSGFLSGEAFASPHEDTQELAYHLAQIVVRSLCSQQPRQFFAMAREAVWDDGGREAARQHLGVDLERLVSASVGLPDADD